MIIQRNRVYGVYSWQGQSSLGSCITSQPQTWVQNITTHAPGTFLCNLGVTANVSTIVDLVSTGVTDITWNRS